MKMATIKQLPRTVYSSLRSSVIFFDLSRVVEELIYNSIDAGATKVHVAINVGECYVKVEDDGCGMTRDGLVLIGEKYATSKLCSLAEMDVASENLGFRGEALGSLSDVSLLEVTTKARGRPNAYRKIIKGCKCLYLGIDDDRKELGTTVVVRDLFYNQPVRRKYMHSSPKKVLHSVKKCMLRVALVHPQVSFKVKDAESGDELLHTHSSTSPLPLVSSGFGLDVCHFHEMNFSKGIWDLSGYMSAPVDILFMKAFQYFYINSRFVCKGPIQKLLNNLADSFSCSDMWRGASGFQNEKRSRVQTGPAYILNLRCPRSNYDLNFEPSKTVVEFKEWVSVLSFIEQAIMQFWRQMAAQGVVEIPHGKVADVSRECAVWKKDVEILLPGQDIFVEDLPMDPEILKKKYRIQYDRNLLHPVASEETDLLLHPKKRRRQSEDLQHDLINYFHQFSYSSQPMSPTESEGFHLNLTPVVSQEHLIQIWPPYKDTSSVKGNILCSEVTRRTFEDGVDNHIFDSRWDNNILEIDVTLNERSRERSISSCFDHKNDVRFPLKCPKNLRKPFLRGCSLLGNGPSPENMPAVHKTVESKNEDTGKVQRRQSTSDNLITALETDSKHNLDISPENSLSKISASTHYSNGLTSDFTRTDLNVRSTDFVDYCPTNGVCFTDQNDLFNESLDQFGKRGSNSLCTNAARKTVSPYSTFGSVGSEVDHSSDEYFASGNYTSHKSPHSNIYRDAEMDYKLLSYANMQYSSNEEDPISNYTSVDVDYEHPRQYLCGSPSQCQSIIQRFDTDTKFSGDMEWLYMDPFVTDNANNRLTPTKHISSPYCHEPQNPRVKLGFQHLGPSCFYKERSRRSHSAPPFYKGKSKFSTIYNFAEIPDTRELHSPTLKVTSGLNHSSEFCNVSQHHFEQSPVKDSLHYMRAPTKMMQYGTGQIKQELTSNELEGLELSEVKWRDRNQLTSFEHDRDKSQSLCEQNDILDTFSGFLHLAGGSVVPESVTKDCLADAKVLLQLDKKFIPVVAGTTLAVIDQHAADERIRLEELRNKVLSGEGKSVSYLDSEQELVLPEIGHQLLQNYAEEIQNWGWICNVHAQGSGSFTKNVNLLHRRTSVITLLAVPCILGVKLSDKDLLEFLEQLAETDGSSTLPPSVIRVLNFKACRGAIMFGDALLPSECSLIIEELKQTSLCFQCAHGRPTTVPLVNLDVLHKQIASLNNWNKGPDEPWHGLHHHRPSLERARQRLICARGQHGREAKNAL